MAQPWHIRVDTGGTFTDCIARAPDGSRHRVKVLSNGTVRGRVAAMLDERRFRAASLPDVPGRLFEGLECRLDDSDLRSTVQRVRDGVFELASSLESLRAGVDFELRWGEEAPIVAARLVTGTPRGEILPAMSMRLATTRGTNALLERKGAATVLFITRGFGDLLLIGDQRRPDLFALEIRRPRPLYASVIEVDERLDAAGNVLRTLDEHGVDEPARMAVARGHRSAAIALLHSYRNPVHEHALARRLRWAGFEHVTCSGDLAPLIRLLPRAQTVVVNAYLAEVIGDYLRDVRGAARGGRLHVMTSAGGLVDEEQYAAKDSLFSGPAGGVAGAAAAARRSGFERVISFDMGGTSTDVARYDGDFEYRFTQAVGDAELLAPALAIETVAAGGGSICAFRHGRIRVGPGSAGAAPGPACYGMGGPLTLTDVNLLLGRLDPGQFGIPVRRDRAEGRLAEVLDEVRRHRGADADSDALLEGFLELANERMADAISQISIRRGFDPKDYGLVAFGGAGPQHACAVAERMAIDTIIMPADASMLSAVGLDAARLERIVQRQVLRDLDEVAPELESLLADMEREATEAVTAAGAEAADVEIRRRIVNLRLRGQDATLPVEPGRVEDLAAAFGDAYRDMYGHHPASRALEVESLQVIGSAGAPRVEPAKPTVDTRPREPGRHVRARFGGAWRRAAVWRRDELTHGDRVEGPALVFAPHTTYVIEPGWSAHVDGADAIIARRRTTRRVPSPGAAGPEIVRTELFSNRLTSIAEEMGRMLERTAVSTNVKERLDFSCAMLDADGTLVVNAPHIPVHLGALGICVREVAKVLDMRPGDVVITNHPAYGGSHLPDVTVITPVFDEEGRRLAYVASRAHHAELGGSRPGSMPPAATTLAEEGAVIPPMRLVEEGQVACYDRLERLLRQQPHPTRALPDNLADIQAAVAANQRGVRAVRSLAEQHGREWLTASMNALCTHAEQSMHEALRALPDGVYRAVEHLDDGAPIAVEIAVRDGTARIDFAGTAAQHAGNLNATPAIVHSAVIYVLRLLVGARLTLNEGLMRAIDLRIPPGLLNPSFTDDPRCSPAVVGGNVETSQRVVDVLLKALGLCAGSQGTMNNVLFGGDRFGYYETVGGGSGAGPGFHGASAVHTHMTNTRITDPETLEHRFPARLHRFQVRRGSGGAGAWNGGDGAVREIEFLEPMALSIISQHRTAGPYGLDGGSPGRSGHQHLLRTSGERVELRSVDGCDVGAGDRLVLETPGGGGYGRPTDPREET